MPNQKRKPAKGTAVEAAAENIIITEVTRKTGAGRFAYAFYKGRVVRRKAQRGRPHYDLVTGITLGAGDKPVTREVSVTSQVARQLLGA
jgi:hypothetical protein